MRLIINNPFNKCTITYNVVYDIKNKYLFGQLRIAKGQCDNGRGLANTILSIHGN